MTSLNDLKYAATLSLAFALNGAQAAEPPALPAMPASAASAPTDLPRNTPPTSVVIPTCTLSAQNVKGSFLGGLVQHLVEKKLNGKVDGLGEVAGRSLEATIKTEQPSCARLPDSTTTLSNGPFSSGLKP